MSDDFARDDVPTLAAVGVLAATFAALAHEAVGHGAGCLAAGGEVTLLTSINFRCLGATALTDAGGPLGNLAAGLLALAGFFAVKPAAGRPRLFLALLAGVSLSWFAGQLVVAGATGGQDEGFVARALQWPETWRWIAVAAGLAVYAVTLRLMTRVFGGLGAGGGALRARVGLPWLAGGVSAVAAALMWMRAPLASAQDAFLSLTLAPLPLWLSLNRAARLHSGPITPVHRSWAWIAAAVVVFAAFALVVGRGLGRLT